MEDTMMLEEPNSRIATEGNDLAPNDKITLTDEGKARIQRPWSYSVIIKLLGKKMSHDYLKRRLIALWKPTEEIVLIDLGFDYFIIKFLKEENMHTEQKGP